MGGFTGEEFFRLDTRKSQKLDPLNWAGRTLPGLVLESNSTSNALIVMSTVDANLRDPKTTVHLLNSLTKGQLSVAVKGTVTITIKPSFTVTVDYVSENITAAVKFRGLICSYGPSCGFAKDLSESGWQRAWRS